MREIEHGSTATKLVDAAAQLIAQPSRARVLERIAHLAPRVIPAADHASVTVPGPMGLRTVASTGPVAMQVDALQYELDEGPCVSATRTGAFMLVADLSVEPRWPRFASRIAAARQPVASMLAVPLRAGAQVEGSLNLSSAGTTVFRDATAASALVFAALAAVALRAVTDREQAAMRTARVRELEDFTAVLGHDLRSGVTGALAAAAVLARRRNQLDPAGRQALDLLTDELASQMRLLLDLLHLARGRAGDAEPQSVALLPLVDQVLSQHRAPVQLRVHPAAERALVTMPAVHVRRILANVLDNAARHGGGATAVEVGRDGDRAWVAVDDAGPGVPPEQRAYVFGRFWTRPSAAPNDGGLGLALSREHARSAGGDVTVGDSAAGGARFVLTLPTVDAPAATD